MMTLAYKTCIKCGVTKDIEEFYRHPGEQDGREGVCKKCKIAYNAIRRKKNRKKKREQQIPTNGGKSYTASPPYSARLEQVKAEFREPIEEVIVDYLNRNNNISITAELLGVTPKTLSNWIKHYNIRKRWVVGR